MITDSPELAIVSRETWEAAQARHRVVKRGAQVNGRKRVRLLSGLLRCGVCGSSMSIVSTRTEGRVRYSNYGCSARLRSLGDV
jgi:site-specific DNA recombinase